MKVSFKQLLQPANEAIIINGEPFFLNKKYDNVVREDETMVFTFKKNGVVHLELKQCREMGDRDAYVTCNNFMNTYLHNGIRLTKRQEGKNTIIFGFLEYRCKFEQDGKLIRRSVNIENALTLYPDSTCEHNGINFFIEDTVVDGLKKKKKKKK